MQDGELIRAIGSGEPSVLTLAHRGIRHTIAQAQQRGDLPMGDADAKADVIVHVMLGYFVAPSLAVDSGDTEAVAELARSAISPILFGRVIQGRDGQA